MIALTLLTLVTAAPPEAWPEFRGPRGDGHAAETASPPVKFGEAENLKWKVPVHDKGWSSPVVWGDQVWVTTATEIGAEYFAICFDRATGKTIYDLKLLSIPAPTDIRRYNSYASPTPAIEAGRLYAHFGSFGTFCIDTASGKLLWDKRDLPCDHFRGPASSPVLYDGKLYLVFDGFDRQYVACVDKTNGRTIWTRDRKLPYRDSGKPDIDNDYKKAFATPSILESGGRMLLVAPAATGTCAYDPQTGDEVWRVITDGMNQASRPLLAAGNILVTAGHTSTLVAIRPGGQGDVTKSNTAWKFPKSAPTRPSPVVVGDTIYFVNDTGTLYALDAATGKERWRESLDGKFSASPIYAGGHLYLANELNKVFVVKPGPGFNLIETVRLSDGCRASPAAVGKQLFLRTYSHLYCFEAK